MEQYIKVILKMEIFMEKDQFKTNKWDIQVNGRRVKNMVKEHIFLKMVLNMKVNIKMI